MKRIKKEEYFIKLPNNLIWVHEEGEVSLIKGENTKLVLVLSELLFRTTAIGECYFTLEDIIKSLGYTPKSGKGKINEQIKSILIRLRDLGFITNSNVDFEVIKTSTLIKCDINNNISTNKDGKDSEFFMLYYRDYKKILHSESKLDKDISLNIFCYISARIYNRAKNNRTESEHGLRNEGRAETTYFTYKDVLSDLDISKGAFAEHIKMLNSINILFYDNIGLVKNQEGKVYSANNVYVTDESELKYALNDSKHYYREEKKCLIIGKKSNEVTKQEVGLKGKIVSEENKGNDTTELKEKLEEIKEYKDVSFDNIVDETFDNNSAPYWGRPSGFVNKKEKKKNNSPTLGKPKSDIQEEWSIENEDWSIDVDEMREVVTNKIKKDIIKYKTILENWSKENNITLRECDDYCKLLELSKRLDEYDKIYNVRVIPMRKRVI